MHAGKYLSLLSHWVLCLCKTVDIGIIPMGRILCYMYYPQDELKFYILINFNGRPDFVTDTLRPENMFMKLSKHCHQTLCSTFHASRCKPGGNEASGRACVLTAAFRPSALGLAFFNIHNKVNWAQTCLVSAPSGHGLFHHSRFTQKD